MRSWYNPQGLATFKVRFHGWWLRPTTVLKYQSQNDRWSMWGSSTGLGAKFENRIWTFPIPAPRESFFEWTRTWIVRRTPPSALRQTFWNPRGYRLYGPKRDGYRHPKSSLFEQARRDRQWDWELRVRHIYDVESKDEKCRRKRFET
jgi:hypothetical protein